MLSVEDEFAASWSLAEDWEAKLERQCARKRSSRAKVARNTLASCPSWKHAKFIQNYIEQAKAKDEKETDATSPQKCKHQQSRNRPKLPLTTAKKLTRKAEIVYEHAQRAKENRLEWSLSDKCGSTCGGGQRHTMGRRKRKSTQSKKRNRSAMEGVDRLPQANGESKSVSGTETWFPQGPVLTPEEIVDTGTAMAVEDTKDERCPVCLGDFDDAEPAIHMDKCGEHYFHSDCLKQSLEISRSCPVCYRYFTLEVGPMPTGTMTVTYNSNLPLEGTSKGSYTINYIFSGDVQEDRHPHPGVRYSGTSRTAYLPDSDEGREVAIKFLRAWDAKVLFRVGQSITCMEWYSS